MNNEHGIVWWVCAGMLAAVLLWVAKPIAEVIRELARWVLGR